MLDIGLQHTSTAVVDETNIASVVGSGDLDVFSTPAMTALMENAAMLAVSKYLEKGSSTVGAMLNIVHTRASGMGETISATAVLKEIDGRKLIFHVSAQDSKGVIGEGVHERFIVDVERFMGKLR